MTIAWTKENFHLTSVHGIIGVLVSVLAVLRLLNVILLVCGCVCGVWVWCVVCGVGVGVGVYGVGVGVDVYGVGVVCGV